nr:hypothetical protein [Burkholderia multivorans]
MAFDRDTLDDESAEQHRLLRQLWLDAVDLHAVTWMWSTWSFDALDAHLRRYVVNSNLEVTHLGRCAAH